MDAPKIRTVALRGARPRSASGNLLKHADEKASQWGQGSKDEDQPIFRESPDDKG